MCVGREEHVSTIPYDGQSSTFEKHNSDSIMHVGVTMATLHSRCGHYIFVLWLLSSFFYSSPNLSGRRLDVYHTSTHGVALVQI